MLNYNYRKKMVHRCVPGKGCLIMNQVFKRYQTLKKLCFLLLLPLMVITLASCNSSLPKLDKNKPVSINIWHHYLGEQKVMFDSLVAEFNNSQGAQKGITVKAYSMDNTGDIHKKLMSSATGEPGSTDFPDMATAYPSTAYTLYKMDKQVSLEKYMSSEDQGKYVRSFWEEGRLTPESGVIIFPVAKSTEALYINYTFYKQFKDDYNSKNPDKQINENMLSTFEGIQETAAAYYKWTDDKTPDKPNDGKALYGFDAASNFMIVGFEQLGSNFFSVHDDTGDIDLNNPAMDSVSLWIIFLIALIFALIVPFTLYEYQSEQAFTPDNLIIIHTAVSSQ
jgi:multiple sugar transport system substrate-binding protein